jgi:TolB-like protein/cytochrome c-type biogenesis protein CcmH/NrfG
VTEPSRVVFLSYASQDAEAAQKICAALHAGGIEVFLDQSELRGGDAWDQKIRHQIHDCALFMPIVSQHTQERLEGYFRLEWKLAVDRSHLMATERPFLVPVVVDATRDHEAFVPDAFRAVHWTRLPGGETPPAFVERIKRLLSPAPSPMSAVSGAAPGISERVPTSWRWKPLLLAIAAVLMLAAPAYFLISKFWTPSAAVFAPPPHSIAVLPFVNMSGDKEQEYFSEGLTEEILNSLADVNTLQVAARTSSFYFKGKDVDLGTIARKLNVATVLEGSVRRSGNTVRVTTQLINAVTGYHLWSHTYDRDLGDVLKLETEIAGAVASALEVTLLGDVSAKIELGGTRNPAAFDAYLRGSKAYASGQEWLSAIAAFTDAIRLDSHYALAFAGRSNAYSSYAAESAIDAAIREKAHADARQAIALAPELAEGHLALARFFQIGSLDFRQASDAYERALTLAPGSAQVLRESGHFAVLMGHFDAGLDAGRRAVVLDPLNPRSHYMLGRSLYAARRYDEALAAYAQVISLDPDQKATYAYRALAYYAVGNFQSARSICESKAARWQRQWCLALAYDKLGRHVDAEAELARLKAEGSEAAAYQYVTIYAQWGDRAKALEWLDTAIRLRDSGLAWLKTDPLLDPLRNEPRFQAVMRELKFPD